MSTFAPSSRLIHEFKDGLGVCTASARPYKRSSLGFVHGGAGSPRANEKGAENACKGAATL